jgi:glycosyltransferase involved in cell wall biosynthesis
MASLECAAKVDAPRVSVVITALNRPVELDRAIKSVLAQSFQNFEIIVVIDGPTEAIDQAHVAGLDTRIRILALVQNVGLAEARNCGIQEARGRWVALLDDDDEWLPRKLEAQVKAAHDSDAEFLFAPCRFIERTLEMDRVMPEALPQSAKNFSEYIYCKHGYLQPSMYFFSRALGLAVPFTKGLRHVEDSDWMLRMSRWPGVAICSVHECLSVYYNYKQGVRESETTPWKFALEWGVRNHELFSRRAFPYFVARLCVNARRGGESPRVLWRLIQTARRYGVLTPRVVAYFLSYWLLPPGTLRGLREAFVSSGRRKSVKVSSMAAENDAARLGGQSC